MLGAGQLHAQAQQRVALKIQAIGVFAEEPFVGGGLALAWRTTSRFTVEVGAAAGAQAQGLTGRAEALAAFHLDPFRTRGVSPYAGGGIAAAVRSGATAEYLVVLLGVESRPGRRRGWFAELGLGGGVRAALGARVGLR
jgi:hypothetical protein